MDRKQKIINQLEGFLQTPPLWKHNKVIQLNQFDLPKVDWENFKMDLSNLPGNLSMVLGKRMESFFALAVNLSNNYKVKASNLQINENKITLGELDFLIMDKIYDQLVHVEIVYKFYVYDPSFNNELERWIGPNRRDTFLYKIGKLQKKQLPLLFHPQTRNQLEKLKLEINNPIQEVCFKALLFVPFNLQQQKFDIINNDCISGYYISFSEFQLNKYSHYQYFIPYKLDWPVHPSRNKIWNLYEETLEKVRENINNKKSPLIWIKKEKNVFERIFIVWW